MRCDGRDILSILDYDRKSFDVLFQSADEMKSIIDRNKALNVLKGKILLNVFYEDSTRTRLSFGAAMMRLGGAVQDLDLSGDAKPNSSWRETLPDTARSVNGYGDVAVVRHSASGALLKYAQYSEIPVINGGSGHGDGSEHPTQSLLDIYTISRVLGGLDGLHLLLIGSIKKRAARSLILGLSELFNSKISVLCPEDALELSATNNIGAEKNARFAKVDDIEEIITDVDVIYHSGVAFSWNDQLPERYFLTKQKLRHARRHLIVLHPLPRSGSISVDVDRTPHAKYFENACNGTSVRMALLTAILGATV